MGGNMGIWMAMKTEEQRVAENEKRKDPDRLDGDPSFTFFFLLPGAANNPTRLYADPDWSIGPVCNALGIQAFKQSTSTSATMYDFSYRTLYSRDTVYSA